MLMIIKQLSRPVTANVIIYIITQPSRLVPIMPPPPSLYLKRSLGCVARPRNE
jgi:hypothetical protein